jgi:electron transport complex protein RnfG
VNIPNLETGLSSVQLYRLREGKILHALFLKATTAKGYSGDIEFAMAVRPDGKIMGVRVIRHRETPGLGDLIETARSSWIRAFEGKSLENPQEALWHVKKDGGMFDQFTGATITPRAVVKGVYDSLKILRTNGETQEGP